MPVWNYTNKSVTKEKADFLISSDLLNNKEPQINTDERRFRMQYPRLSALIRG